MKHIKTFALFEAKSNKPKKEKGEDPWWKEYTKYKLSAYPVNIPKEDVTIDVSGDIDSHPVMTWISPTTGKKVYAYTKARMDAQKEQKYSRIGSITDDEVEKIKVKCHEDILSPDSKESTKEAAAIICIIAQTGLRPGSKKGFMETENRGVMTLSPDNVKIKGPKISLEFTGKSYQKNNAEINDGILANYLQDKIKKDGSEFVFNVSKDTVENYYKNTLKMDKFKIKDLRTYMAGKLAAWFLENNPVPVIPKEPNKIKKIIKDILKKAFEFVSNKLNNTAAMAKNSYIDPSIINDWLDKLGIRAAVVTETKEKQEVAKDFEGNAPLFDLPEWWDDEEVELVKEK